MEHLMVGEFQVVELPRRWGQDLLEMKVDLQHHHSCETQFGHE
jgi:hypothetical protein